MKDESLFPGPDHDHAQCADAVLAHAQHVCSRRGARLTNLRRQVLEALASDHQAIGAYEIIARMGGDDQLKPAPISVYRALEFLEAHGLVHKIESLNAYVACSHGHKGEHAVLLICEACGMVAEIPGDAAFQALDREAAAQGFSPKRAIVELSGRCGRCAEDV
jgi:Fur family transcriptional regulator, zinc uptake regulator